MLTCGTFAGTALATRTGVGVMTGEGAGDSPNALGDFRGVGDSSAELSGAGDFFGEGDLDGDGDFFGDGLFFAFLDLFFGLGDALLSFFFAASPFLTGVSLGLGELFFFSDDEGVGDFLGVAELFGFGVVSSSSCAQTSGSAPASIAISKRRVQRHTSANVANATPRSSRRGRGLRLSNGALVLAPEDGVQFPTEKQEQTGQIHPGQEHDD